MKPLLERHLAKMVIEHKDGKCGPCLKKLIKCEVGEEFLKKDSFYIADYYKEVERRWRETDIYKEVQNLLDHGFTMNEIEDMLGKEGYIV